MINIYLDNIDFSSECAKGLQDVVITERRQDGEGYVAFSFSSKLEFIGSAYDYISDRLITDLEQRNVNSITATIEDDCCGFKKDFVIRSNNISFCDNYCRVAVDLTENNEEVDYYNKLSQTVIWDGLENGFHPRIEYCTEFRPRGLHVVLILIAVVIIVQINILTLICNSLNLVTKAVNLIIKAIDALPIVKVDPIPTFDKTVDTLKTAKEQVVDFVYDTGNTHPSPLIRDYIENCCNKYGVIFKSSILNDANSVYYNTCIMWGSVTKGTDDNDLSTYFIERDQPIMTCTQLLDKLKPVWNAEWRIIGNTLYFETKEFFLSKNVMLDVTQMQDADIVEFPCYNFLGNERPALLHIAYMPDALDNIANEAMEYYEYYQTWNDPYSASQTGTKEVMLEFAPARFRQDNIKNAKGKIIKSIYDTDFGSFVGIVFGLQQKGTYSMLLNNGKTMTPKLLIWDGNNRGFARVTKEFASLGVYNYNKPLWASELAKYYEIDNPRNPNFPQYDCSVTVAMTCDLVSKMDINKPIKVGRGVVQVHEIVYNFSKRTITINGII